MPYFKDIMAAAKKSDGKIALDKLLKQEGVCINEFHAGTTAAGMLAREGDIESVKVLMQRGAILPPILQGLAYAPTLTGDKYRVNLEFAKSLCAKFQVPNDYLIYQIAAGNHDAYLTSEQLKHEHYIKGHYLYLLRALYKTAEKKDIPKMKLYLMLSGIDKDFRSLALRVQLLIDNELKLIKKLKLKVSYYQAFLAGNIDFGFKIIKQPEEEKGIAYFDYGSDLTDITEDAVEWGHWQAAEYLLEMSYKNQYANIPLQKLSALALLSGHFDMVKLIQKKFNVIPYLESLNNSDIREKFLDTYINPKIFTQVYFFARPNLDALYSKLLLYSIGFNLVKPDVIDKTLKNIKMKDIPHVIKFSTKSLFTAKPCLQTFMSRTTLFTNLMNNYKLDTRTAFAWSDPTVQLFTLQAIQLVMRNKIAFDLFAEILTYLTPITLSESAQLLKNMYFYENKNLILHGIKHHTSHTAPYKKLMSEYRRVEKIYQNVAKSTDLNDLTQKIMTAQQKVKTHEYKKFFSHIFDHRLGRTYNKPEYDKIKKLF